MAMTGLGSLAWIFLLLDTLLLPVNPTGPGINPNQLFQHIPNSATIVFHVDLRSIKKQFEKSMFELSKQPFVAKDETIKMMFDQMDQTIKRGIKGIERELKGLKVDDIRFITAAFKFKKRMSKPDVMITVHGNFSLKTLETFIAKSRRKRTRVKENGYVCFYASTRSKPSYAWTPKGQILMATPKWLKELVKKGPQKATMGSLKANMITSYKPNHVLAFGAKMTNKMRYQFRRVPMIFQTLLLDLDQSYAAIWGGGSQLTVNTTNTQAMNRYRLILEGLGQLGMSSDYLRRGLVDIIDGAFAPDVKKNRGMLATLAHHKAAMLVYVRQMFTNKRLQYNVSTKGKSASLRFTGNGGALMPILGGLAGFGMLSNRRSRSPRPARAYKTKPAMPIQPAKPMPAPKKQAP